jgi:hypothetical protein
MFNRFCKKKKQGKNKQIKHRFAMDHDANAKEEEEAATSSSSACILI